jgi:DNA-directed RNA polymerase subunit L
VATKPGKVRTVEFRRLLSDDNALRVRFELERGQVIQFVVQLECCLTDEWIPVIRYDTAHNFAHCDRLHPYEPTLKTRLVTRDHNEALTFAIRDLTNNWDKYRERYEKWLEQE